MAITASRVRKALAERITRAALRVGDRLDPQGRLRCNACGRQTPGFSAYGGRPFGCPYCLSSNRERFVLAALEAGKIGVATARPRILHVAPSERGIARRFAALGDVVPADLNPKRYAGVAHVMSLDLTELSSRTDVGQFDIIYASHVLEHIKDDLCVMRGMWDRLNPGGEAWILVPLHDKPTLEGNGNETPAERERLFGLWDHVRMYGPDIRNRLENSDFAVKEITPVDLGGKAIAEHCLDPSDKIFVCRKASQ